jgi:very-short-patch-repair endonuclease
MDPTIPHISRRGLWELASRQHGVVSRKQLLELGFDADAIKHRVARGRLHAIHRGVYAVGRPELTRYGEWTAATLACGSESALSDFGAAALWELMRDRRGPIEISVPAHVDRKPKGIVVHRRRAFETTRQRGIPVTTPICTIVQLAPRLTRGRLEAVINEADIRGLASPDAVRDALDAMGKRPGAALTRAVLDRRTFRLTRSGLERRLIPIALAAGLPRPLTRYVLHGFEVDFYWPELGLVVESDGLRYHRTPAQQAKDRLRDQVLTAAGLTVVRFTDEQIAHEREYVQATLAAVAARLAA